MSITYVHNGDIFTNDPADYQRQLRSGSRMSRHEQERRLAEASRRAEGG